MTRDVSTSVVVVDVVKESVKYRLRVVVLNTVTKTGSERRSVSSGNDRDFPGRPLVFWNSACSARNSDPQVLCLNVIRSQGGDMAFRDLKGRKQG